MKLVLAQLSLKYVYTGILSKQIQICAFVVLILTTSKPWAQTPNLSKASEHPAAAPAFFADATAAQERNQKQKLLAAGATTCNSHHKPVEDLSKTVALNGFFNSVKIDQALEFSCEGSWLAHMTTDAKFIGPDLDLYKAIAPKFPKGIQELKDSKAAKGVEAQIQFLRALAPAVVQQGSRLRQLAQAETALAKLKKDNRVMTEVGWVDAPPKDEESQLLSKIKVLGIQIQAGFDAAPMAHQPLFRQFIQASAERLSREKDGSYEAEVSSFVRFAVDQNSKDSFEKKVLEPLKAAHVREREAAALMAKTKNEDQWRQRMIDLGVKADLARFSTNQSSARKKLESELIESPTANIAGQLASDVTREGAVKIVTAGLGSTGFGLPVAAGINTLNELYTVVRDECGLTIGFTGYRRGYCQALDGDFADLDFAGAMLEGSNCLKYSGLTLATAGMGGTLARGRKIARKITGWSNARHAARWVSKREAQVLEANDQLRTFSRYGGDPALRLTPVTPEEIYRRGLANQEPLNNAVKKFGDANGFGVVVGNPKDYERIIAKTIAEKGGDYSRVFDAARATILVNDPDQILILTAKGQLGKKTGKMLGPDFKLEDSSGGFDLPRGSGYRDMKLLFKNTSNGGLVEVQVQVPSMYAAKQRADGEFRYRRQLEGQLELQKARLSASEEADLQKAIAESKLREKSIFDKAWAEFQALSKGAK